MPATGSLATSASKLIRATLATGAINVEHEQRLADELRRLWASYTALELTA
jgi:hypothetical protein